MQEMLRHVATYTAVLLFAAPSGRAEDKTDRLLRELFSRDDPPAATKHIDALLAACSGDAKTLRAVIASDTAYRAFKPGALKRTTTVTDARERKTWEVEFTVRSPRSYTPARSWPLLLAAHGQGGSGPRIAGAFVRLLGGEAEKYVIVAPTLPGQHKYSGRDYHEQTFLKPLAWTCRNLNVDDDRIYVSGYSLGGHTAWHLAVMFPRLFAAAVPMAGIPFFEGSIPTATVYLENLSNLPLWAIWGERDAAPPALGNRDFCRLAARRLGELKNPHFRATELPGKGHGGCWPDRREFVRFLAASRRRPMPQKIDRRFHLAHHSRGYYIEAVELARKPVDFATTRNIPIKVPPGVKPTPEDARKAMEEYFRKRLFQTRAELDRPGGTVTVGAVAVRKLRLYVMDGMAGPEGTMKLKYWHRSWQGTVPVSARCILLHYAERRDQTAIVYNEMDLTSTLSPTVRFK